MWNLYLKNVSRNPKSRHQNQGPETKNTKETIPRTNITIIQEQNAKTTTHNKQNSQLPHSRDYNQNTATEYDVQILTNVVPYTVNYIRINITVLYITIEVQ